MAGLGAQLVMLGLIGGMLTRYQAYEKKFYEVKETINFDASFIKSENH